jgi:hypothetical protein
VALQRYIPLLIYNFSIYNFHILCNLELALSRILTSYRLPLIFNSYKNTVVCVVAAAHSFSSDYGDHVLGSSAVTAKAF